MIEVGPVEYWSSLGDVEQVREAIRSGADVNASSTNGYNALYAAVENDYPEIVRLLLEAGARIDLKLNSGESPLEYAIGLDRREIVRLLRSRGA